MNCLGLDHSSRGHVMVFLFYLAIGIAFLLSSIVYLLNLQRISTSLLHPNCTETETAVPHNGEKVHGSNVSCDIVKIWISIGSVGVVYGSLCVIIAIAKLYTIFKKYPTASIPLAATNPRTLQTDVEEAGSPAQGSSSRPQNLGPAVPSTGPSKLGSLKRATGFHAVKRAQRHARKLISRRSDWHGKDLTCLGCFGIFVEFVLAIFFWLASLLLPLYVSYRLISTDAIRVDDDQLYALSLAIFCVAVVNLTIVTGSSIVMTMEAEDDIDGDLKEEWQREQNLMGRAHDDGDGGGGGEAVSTGLGSSGAKGWSFSGGGGGGGGINEEEEEPLISSSSKTKKSRAESV